MVDVYRFDVEATAHRPAISLIIWDTDGNFGEAIFKHIYMKQAAAALIIGDLSRLPTLDTMAKLGEGFQQAFPGRHVGYILNKTDLVAEHQALPLPANLTRPGTSLMRTSAKSGQSVRDAFVHAADTIVRRAL